MRCCDEKPSIAAKKHYGAHTTTYYKACIVGNSTTNVLPDVQYYADTGRRKNGILVAAAAAAHD